MIDARSKPRLLAATLSSLALAGPVRAEGELQMAELGRCPLASGQAIEDCRVGYRTLGRLNADRSNAMLVPTWYTGTSARLIESGEVGPGGIADSTTHFVIIVDAFANGVSTSPSNSIAQPMERFPRVGIGDMVDAQHRLLTEALGLDHVQVVQGISMGGMQTLEWVVRYPGFMDAAVAIEGTPWMTAYDRVLWNAMVDAAEVHDGSDAGLALGSRLMDELLALVLWTPDYFVPMVAEQGYAKFMADFAPVRTAGELMDQKYQTWAMLDQDIRRSWPDFTTQVRDRIEARLLSVVFRFDHTVNPAPSRELARLTGSKLVELDSTCGHMGPTRGCDQQAVAEIVHDFLARSE